MALVFEGRAFAATERYKQTNLYSSCIYQVKMENPVIVLL